MCIRDRFKIVQEVSRVVVKAQEVPYRLLLANEDILPCTHIRLHFFDSMVSMKPSDPGVISLAPHEEIRVDTQMSVSYTHLDVYKRQGIYGPSQGWDS